LAPFFEPRGVAVIGSMKEPQGEGYVMIQNMLQLGFSGQVYPISRSCEQVLGLRAYSAVNEVSDPIDLVVIVTPPPTVSAILEQCGDKGVSAVIIVSEGFAEASQEGAILQQQLVDTAHRTGMRILGPNTQGVLNTSNGLITGPYPCGSNRPLSGGIAYCSQTGLLTFASHPVGDRAYPISKVCDFGNKCDVHEADVLPYLANDPQTRVIVMHLEDVKDGQRFLKAAREAVARKPVLIFKPGRSEAAARAVASHTGSLAGDDQVWDTVFKQAGVIRINTWRDFWEVPRALSLQPLPTDNRVAIISATGGGGVLLVDAATEAGLVPATFTAATLKQLERLSPRLAQNPVDTGPHMVLRDNPFSIYEDVVPIVLADTGVDCAIVVCHANPPVVDVFERLMPRISNISKPIVLFGYGVDLAEMQESARRLEALGLPTYFDLDLPIKALAVGVAYSKISTKLSSNTDKQGSAQF